MKKRILLMITLAGIGLFGCQTPEPTKEEVARAQKQKIDYTIKNYIKTEDSENKQTLLTVMLQDYDLSQIEINKILEFKPKKAYQDKLVDLSYLLAVKKIGLPRYYYSTNIKTDRGMIRGTNNIVNADRFSMPKEFRLLAKEINGKSVIARGRDNIAYTPFYNSLIQMKKGMPPVDRAGGLVKICKLTQYSNYYYEINASDKAKLPSPESSMCLSDKESSEYWKARAKTLVNENNELIVN